ncbi:YfcE family phosphodiesterase [Syntrophomonas palmitatica]|uniref:YfcE family phosphodiesterase n=1 Tax=Syntrophomonas palmitatica TaxID=402877 RepID=UPI0006D09DFF|nr:metallophosphoesterase [Syntrophomonas palmitatica]
MRIAVVGDTHARIEKIKAELQRVKPDLMIFTGDFYADAVRLSHHLGIKFRGVKGNCDSTPAGDEEQYLDIESYHFYIIHGHQYGVKNGLQSLYYRGEEKQADVVLFGHTHVPFCEKINKIWFLNPAVPHVPVRAANPVTG